MEQTWAGFEPESVFGQWSWLEQHRDEEAQHVRGSMGVPVSALLDLMRPKNLVLAAATVPLGAYFGTLAETRTMNAFPVMLHALAVVCFMGAGNAMNDLKDAAIDRDAHPHRPLPSGRITPEGARRFTIALWMASAVAHLAGVLVSGLNQAPDVTAVVGIYVLAVVLMLTFDHGPATKHKGLPGNIVISLLVGAVVLYGAASLGGLFTARPWYIFGVVFFTNLARELIKDCMDMDADAGSRTTLPMTIGVEKVRALAYIMVMASLVCLYLPFWRGPFEFGQLVLQLPAILMLITLNGPMYQGHDVLVAGRIRGAMLVGLIGFLVAGVV